MFSCFEMRIRETEEYFFELGFVEEVWEAHAGESVFDVSRLVGSDLKMFFFR